MIAINFYNFTKRPNSTKLPGSPSASYQALIWEGSSLDQPVLKMQIPKPVGGYCHIPDYGRYYFVRHWKFEGGFWWAYLDVDVLANGRSQIMSSTQYIARSSVGYNSYLVDNTRPSPAKTVSTTNSFKLITNTDQVLVSVAGVGGASLYAMSYASFINLSKYMFSTRQESLWDTIISATAQNFIRTFINPFEYILGCYVIGATFSTNYNTPVELGYWTTGVTGRKISVGSVVEINRSIAVPKNPYASGNKSYLVSEPYSSYTLTLPGVGTHKIPAIRLWDVSSLTIKSYFGADGSVVYEVRTPSNILATYATRIRSELPLSASTPDVVGGVSSAVSAGLALTRPTGAVSALSGAAATVDSIFTPEVNTTGGMGGAAATISGYQDVELCGTFYDVTAAALEINGAPRYSTGTLGTAGFYQIINPQVGWCETEAEAKKTMSLLEGGIYVE